MPIPAIYNLLIDRSCLFQLYEEQKEENEKLRKSVTKLTQELSDTKVDLEKLRLRAEPRGTGETAAERKVKSYLVVVVII